jgi:hypothetical protein
MLVLPAVLSRAENREKRISFGNISHGDVAAQSVNIFVVYFATLSASRV